MKPSSADKWDSPPKNSGTDVPSVHRITPDTPITSIDPWLNALARLLNLPADRRRDIIAELEEHLHERVRDLMLQGRDESAAVHQAISELGDAAVVAARFKAVEKPSQRRTLMNVLIATAAAVALATSTVALRNSGSIVSTSTQTGSGPVAATEGTLDESKATITLPADASLEQFFREVARLHGKTPRIDAAALKSAEIDPARPLGVPLRSAPLHLAVALFHEQVSAADPIGWQIIGDEMEFSFQSKLDARTIELVVYDLSNVIDSYPSNQSQIIIGSVQKLITDTVEPEYWRENGGDIATINLVGRKLFIRAPKRLHTQIRWLLEQAASEEQAPVSNQRRPRQDAGAPADPPADGQAMAASTLYEVRGERMKHPGVYQLPVEGKLTLLRALSAAGWPDVEGPKKITLKRPTERGDFATIIETVPALLSDPKNDVELRGGDVIEVQ